MNVDLSGAGPSHHGRLWWFEINGVRLLILQVAASWIAEHKGPISYDRRLLMIPAGQAIKSGFNTALMVLKVKGNVSEWQTAFVRCLMMQVHEFQHVQCCKDFLK